ncbi:MAG: 50S ribosomal protein L24e [Candidatus Bathyarchaeia archaeon]
MPRMYRCSFCGEEVKPGKGMIYVRNDGALFWFCSKKCRSSSLKLKRDARKVPWTNYYRKEEKGKG